MPKHIIILYKPRLYAIILSLLFFTSGCAKQTTSNAINVVDLKDKIYSPALKNRQKIAEECKEQDQKAQKNFAQFIHKYKQQLIAFPESPENYFLYGRLLGLLGRPEKAVQFFSLCLQKDPEYIWAHYGMGVYYLKQKNTSQAKTHFQKCLTLDFRFVPALVGMAKINSSTNINLTLYYLYSALSVKPRDISLLSHLGNVLVQNKQYKQAIQTFNKAHILAPKNEEILSNLIKLLINQKHYHKAYLATQKLYRLTPQEQKKKNIKKLLTFLQGMMSE